MLEEIITPRLVLRSMSEDFLAASLADERKKTESLINLKISRDWFDEKEIITVRLADYQADSEYINWGLRAVGLRETKEMIGYIGFHTRPNPSDLQKFAPNAIEFGYVIFPVYRRRGFASEAIVGLLDWAAKQSPIEYFIASISPKNTASTALIKKMRFEKIGEQIDEIDGLELVYAIQVGKFN